MYSLRSRRCLLQANLNGTLQDVQEDFARVSAELVSAQAQIEWLESQASGIETEELLRMIDGKDRTLEEKDTEIERLSGKLENANRAARRHTEVRSAPMGVASMKGRRLNTHRMHVKLTYIIGCSFLQNCTV